MLRSRECSDIVYARLTVLHPPHARSRSVQAPRALCSPIYSWQRMCSLVIPGVCDLSNTPLLQQACSTAMSLRRCRCRQVECRTRTPEQPSAGCLRFLVRRQYVHSHISGSGSTRLQLWIHSQKQFQIRRILRRRSIRKGVDCIIALLTPVARLLLLRLGKAKFHNPYQLAMSRIPTCRRGKCGCRLPGSEASLCSVHCTLQLWLRTHANVRY